VDLGTGDGRFVVSHAASHPDRFVLGVDASADAVRQASRRAPANARFVVAALEALPEELAGVADLVTVQFPWGSLRAAAAGHDPAPAGRIARLIRPGGRLDLLLADGDGNGAGPLDPDAVVAAWRALGLLPIEARPAGLADAVAAHSSWGKRLLRNPRPGRTAWQFRLAGPSAGADGRG
jgi:16S rRNA (adenine(1408)-N(1))-methyltransferase